MEDEPFVASTFHFQGPFALPVKAQAISCNRELVNNLADYAFLGMATPAQVPGLCYLFAEKLANRSHLLSMHPGCSIGINYLASFASDIFENEASSWNTVDKIGNSQLLEGGEKCSSEHGVFYSLRPSAVNSQFYMNSYCKYMNEGEPMQALFATTPPPGQKLIISGSSGDIEKVLYHPHAPYVFMTPTAEECVFQVAGMYQGDAAVASTLEALGEMRTSWASSLITHNIDDHFQGFIPCDVEADGRSHVSYGNKSVGVPEVSSTFHEDTRDLEALMSSDEDEMSTGHSPSDLTWNNMLENQCSGSFKRKKSHNFCSNDFDSCEEVESEFKENHCLSELVPSFINGQVDGYQSSTSLKKLDSGSELLKSNDSGAFYLSSDLQGDVNEKCQDYTSLSGKSGQSTSRKRSRMGNIKRTLEMLRSVIPGGNSMDTADVLGEAIQYVRMLQHKVAKLEAMKMVQSS